MSVAVDDPIRVLHVDDDRHLREVVSMHLEREHDAVSVVTEASASDGLDRLDAERIDCVVSDHDMPGADGLAFLRSVRERHPDVPFVLFTGKGSEQIASEAISAGVTEYLQKGTGSDQYAVLANRIERAVAERRARSALEESERMLSTLIANLPGMVYRCRDEPGWPMTFVSEGAEGLTGYAADAIESGEVNWEADVIADADRDRTRATVERALAEGGPFELTYRIRTADGERRWLWERGRAVEEASDHAVLEGFITDVTDLKERERELDRYRALVESVGDPMYVLDAAGRIEMTNRAMAEKVGHPRAEIEGEPASAFMPAEDVRRAESVIGSVLAEEGRERGRFEMRSLDDDGRVRYNETKLTVLTDDDGAFAGSVGVVRDITERKRRERERQRYETVIQAVGDPVFTLDADGVVTFVNDAMAALSGYDREELVGEPPTVVLDEAIVEHATALVRDLLDGEATEDATFEMELRTRGGDRIPCETHLALLPAEDGEFGGTAGVIRDITERKRRERRLEEFASVVSHDLRGPLSVIQGTAEYAMETGEVEDLDRIAEAAQRMETLVDELLALAREGRGVGDREPVDLAAVARAAWDQVATADGSLDVAVDGTVDADRNRLQQLFENLFRNAIEHGGSADGSGVAVRVGETDAGFFVADDGPGVPPDEREVVFERGYTTSDDGTGYGLAIVGSVVEGHGWEIRATESRDGGTRFEVDT